MQGGARRGDRPGPSVTPPGKRALQSEPIPRRVRRWQRIVGWIILAVTLLAVAATLDAYVAYGTPVWWSNPARLHWCGRDYSRSTGSIERTDIPKAGLLGDKPYPIRSIGRLPQLIGRPILASVTPEARRHEVTPPIPCAMVIYLGSPSGRYVPYVIDGGP